MFGYNTLTTLTSLIHCEHHLALVNIKQLLVLIGLFTHTL